MKLKVLFDKVTFDEAYPYLLPLIEGHKDNERNLREAYDLIRSHEPTKGLVDEVYIQDRGAEYTDDRYGVRFVDGAPWPNELAKTIVYERGGELNEAQVPTTCLWEMTFYGFREEEITGSGDKLELFWEPKVPLLKAAEGMDQKWYMNWGVRRNRLKRKRLYRQKSSVKRLHGQLLGRMALAFPREGIIHLMDMGKGNEYPPERDLYRRGWRIPTAIQAINEY